MAKTKFDSFCIENGIPEGCRRCLAGEKVVLFMTGKCTRNCPYCSLSSNRKNSPTLYANEKPCSTIQEVIKEAEESNATGAGITGGDPLINLNQTLEYAKALKSHFKNFHIHIYLPTTLISEENMKALSECIDEVRVHPFFLQHETNNMNKIMEEDINKMKIVSKFFSRENIGWEMPVLPDKKEKIIEFIKKSSPFIGFVNLNELEISETNLETLSQKYNINEDTFTIAGSKEAGMEILKHCHALNIKVHLCTARTKDMHQFVNRLKKRKILPFGEQDDEGLANYFVIRCKDKNELAKIISELTSKYNHEFYIDSPKTRIIISEKLANKLVKSKKYKISHVVEYPTSDRTELEDYPLN